MSPPKKQKVDENVKPEVDTEAVEEKEQEKDAAEDSRPAINETVRFLTPDTTPNSVISTVGNMLLNMKDPAFQSLCAGVRCNVGIKSGRYAFEVRIVEAPTVHDKSLTNGPKTVLRVGLSTRGSKLMLGHDADSVCFDEAGSFVHQQSIGSQPSMKPASLFVSNSSIVVVLNLDDRSACHNTVSLFVDGRRIGGPHSLPEPLRGKILYPTITYKNTTLHYNFLEEPFHSLPFRCRMLESAAAEDVVVAPESDQLDLIFPIFLPDKGTFDWCDWFMKENGSKYTEFGNRAVYDWALQSGLKAVKPPSKTASITNSNDKPETGFNVAQIDNGSIKDTLLSLSSLQPRSYVVMEVKSNLIREERVSMLKSFSKTAPYRKVAQVMMGIPEEAFKKRVHELLLAEKQAMLDVDFEREKSVRAIIARKRETLAAAQKLAEATIAEDQALKRKAEDMEGEEAKAEEEKTDAADEIKAEADGTAKMSDEIKEEKADKEEKAGDNAAEAAAEGAPTVEQPTNESPVKDETEDVKMEEAEEKDVLRPIAELSGAEKQIVFRKLPIPDLSQVTMDKLFSKFSLPTEDEGFDEIRFTWSPKEECEEHLRRWMVDRKACTRVDDIQPSEWFHERLKDWQKELNGWHVAMMQYKEGSKAIPKVAPKADAPTPSGEEQKAIDDNGGATDAEKAIVDKQEEPADADESKDPMHRFEEELDREYIDVFSVGNIVDRDGSGTPLFADFTFEDWALLSLRFELHIVVHAFRRDVNDPDRPGVHRDHLAYYYHKYFKKPFRHASYGVSSMDDVIALVSDTMMCDPRTRVIESMVSDELESNDVFVKLTEESRRDRLYRIDSGDESAQLHFPRPAGALDEIQKGPLARPGHGMDGPAPIGMVASPGGLASPACFAAGKGHIKTKGKGKGAWNQQQQGGYNGGWQKGGGMQQLATQMMERAKLMQNQWNANFGSMWGQDWRG